MNSQVIPLFVWNSYVIACTICEAFMLYLLQYAKNNYDSFIQIMVTNVTSLLKTVKAVEDEHTRGTRALEATIEAIAQEIRVRL